MVQQVEGREKRSDVLPERFTLRNATPYGGANLICRFLEYVGLKDRLEDALAAHRKAPHAKYSLVQEVQLLVVGRMLGLGRISDFSEVEEDPLLTRLFRLPKLPDVTILYKELVRLGRDAVRQALQPVHEAILARTLGEEVVLDFDSSVETVYGKQEGAKVGYNPSRPGRPSFHPQFCFDGRTRSLIEVELRPGNTVSSTGLIETAERIFSRTVLANRRIALVRGDRGYGNEKFMALLEKRQLEYVLKVTPTRPLRAWADALSYREIGRTALGDVLEVASGMYQAQDWTRARRMVVVRERTADAPKGQIFEIPVVLDEQFMATTLNWDEEDVWHCYNQRCTSETSIRTLKEDWSFDAFSKDGFAANAADLFMKGMAYNLTLAMQQALHPKEHGTVHTAATIRKMWFLLPATVATHARQLFLRLPCQAEHSHYGRAVRALERILTAG